MRIAPELWDIEKRCIQEFEDAVTLKARTRESELIAWDRACNQYHEAKLNLMKLIYEARGGQ